MPNCQKYFTEEGLKYAYYDSSYEEFTETSGKTKG